MEICLLGEVQRLRPREGWRKTGETCSRNLVRSLFEHPRKIEIYTVARVGLGRSLAAAGREGDGACKKFASPSDRL